MRASLPRPLCLGLLVFSLACALLASLSVPACALAAPQAVSLSVGSDNHTHLLWNNPDGSASLWNLDATGSLVTSYNYGPYTDDGTAATPWHASALATGPNGLSHILWTNPDGRVILWTVTDSGSFTYGVYGPYQDGAPNTPWSATALSVGPDNVVHILWTNPDNRVFLWNVDSAFHFTNVLYGPYTDGPANTPWNATALATGPDNISRVVWNNSNGRVMLWNVNAAGSVVASPTYGPYQDGAPNTPWSASAVSVGLDAVTHILWNNPDHRVILWNVDSAFNFTYHLYGLTAGLSAVALATGPDSKSRVLWNGPNGTAQVWTINADGSYTVKVYPSPSALALSPATVTGGSSSTGTVTLNAPAPPAGLAVTLSSSNTSAATVPASVTVPAGAISATFTVSTIGGTSASTATISATANGVSQTATLTINPAQRFKITNINNGDTISGDFEVNISVLDGNLNGNNISFTVDGTIVDSGDIQIQSDGTYAVTMVFPTNDYSNGIHTVAAVDGQGNSDTRNVTLSNAIASIVYDPIFDVSPGVTDVSQTSHLSATLTTPQGWQAVIQDYNGVAVRSYSGNGTTIDLTWDGKSDQGVDVPDDSYDLVMTTTAAGSGAVQPPGGDKAVHRPVSKDRIGDSLILIDQDALRGSISKAAIGMAYEKFIIGLLMPKVDIDFNSRPSVILTTGANVAKYVHLRNRINFKLEVACTLIYVYAHGSAFSKPRFNMGGVVLVSSPAAHSRSWSGTRSAGGRGQLSGKCSLWRRP